MKKSFLLNNYLTCIPNTRTLWHDLLDWIPNLTPIMIDYATLANEAEQIIAKDPPDFIIRNASHFRPLNIDPKIKVFSYLQDVNGEPYKTNQLAVCNSSDVVIHNSEYMKAAYGSEIKVKQVVLPIGTDFDFFHPFTKEGKEAARAELDILPNSVLFVGANTQTKGFDTVLDLIRQTDYNFCLVMKDDYKIVHPRVRDFNRVSHEKLLKIYNACSLILCASKEETLHLAGIEAAACGLPFVARNVGAYTVFPQTGNAGLKVPEDNLLQQFKDAIDWVFEGMTKLTDDLVKGEKDYDPRGEFIKKGFDRETSKSRWLKLIEEEVGN